MGQVVCLLQLQESSCKGQIYYYEGTSAAACYIGSVLEWLGRSYENLEKCRQVKKKNQSILKARFEPATFYSKRKSPNHYKGHSYCMDTLMIEL